jgi:hypothetical protein
MKMVGGRQKTEWHEDGRRHAEDREDLRFQGVGRGQKT